MLPNKLKPRLDALRPRLRAAFPLATIFLLIEFFDELAFTVEGAALPVLRTDLALSYIQIGVLLGAAAVSAGVIEPIIMLLGDTRWRRTLILGGGLAVAATFGAIAMAKGFSPLLIAFALGSPASGAFVTLSQATLMDLNPGRQPEAMARWSLVGSLGNLIGPAALAALLFAGGSWRWAYAGIAVGVLLLVAVLARRAFPTNLPNHRHSSPTALLKGLWQAVTDPKLLRWFGLLELSDLLLDRLTIYLPLYFTDVVGITPAQASLVASLFMLSNLAGDVLTVRLLERIPGRRLVRLSAALAAPLYALWLLAPGVPAKLALLPLLGVSRLGWYPVLQGEAYATRPERSGTVMAVNALAAFGGGAVSAGLGLAAERLGLGGAMWLLLLGPLALLILVPRPRPAAAQRANH
jgi:FSR family fosmidomycin resistance protein-like MFS transporter